MRLIDADALKIENVDLEHGCTVVDYALAVIKSVRDAPTIEAEPVKHGRWIDDLAVWRCDQCLEWLDVEQGTADMNYCPHCGAKMDGVAE